ncbi:MAG: thiamine phosphate synthase [Muribaculaceae bacterium]|nr:thiamine phosphate synthase [Muribaculaceae bacterium]
MLQFITDYNSEVPVSEQVKRVLAGGGNWIQIRMPGATDAEISGVVEDIMPACLEKQAFLLLTDHVDEAKTLNVGGAVLSLKSETLPSKARVFLGAAAVVAVSVNNIEDVRAVRSLDVDCVILTPFRGKDTGNPDAPELGVEGVRSLIKAMHDEEIMIPTVAAGDIRFDDIAPLFDAGISGLAVSSAIADAPDITVETAQWVSELAKYERRERKEVGL